MNQTEYYKAAVPEPWTILGLELKPFSAGHLILLHRVESSFVTDGPVTWDDMALSVFICSKTFEDAAASFNDPFLHEVMADWYKQITEDGTKELNLYEKAELFWQYMADGHKCPDYIYKEGGSDIGDIPVVQFVKAYVMARMTMTETEFLNRPWALSMWDFLTLQSQEGQVRLCNDETLSDAYQVAEKLAKLAEEGKLCPSSS